MQSLLEPPLFQQLKGCQNILLAGCGGGYDVFSGIPLYFALKSQGKNVFLSNLSFTLHGRGPSEPFKNAEEITPYCFAVTADTVMRNGNFMREYFPEQELSAWFRHKEKSDVTVYTIDRMAGVKPTREIYIKLAERLELDAVVLCDGGTDSVMRGDEEGTGSPEEDMTTIVAMRKVPIKTKILACLGFGVDCFHGVSHGRFLENVADLTKRGAFLGILQLLPTMKEAQKFKEAYEACNPVNSIVCSSVASAIDGEFGNHHHKHTKSRTNGSELFISALMSQYWFFAYEAILDSVVYAEHLEDTHTHTDVRTVIAKWEAKYRDKKGLYTGPRGKLPIPY